MKKYSTLEEILFFVFIFAIFLLPPVYISLTQDLSKTVYFTDWNFPLTAFFNVIFCGIIYLFYVLRQKNNNQKKNRLYFFYKILFPMIFTAGILFTTGLICKASGIFFYRYFSIDLSSDIKVSFPDSLIKWIFCFLNFIFSGFTEEFLYRFYIPEAWIKLTEKMNIPGKKIIKEAGEICILCLFAIAHSYEGILAVVNAALAHIILRLCFKKSGNIYAGFGAHIFYNIISLILL